MTLNVKKWILSGIILVFILIGCSQLFKFEETPNFVVEGVVLSVSDDTALMSLRLDLTEQDLNKSYEEWMNGSYDLMEVSYLQDVKVGMKLKVALNGEILESYPSRASAKSDEVIGEVEASEDEAGNELVMESVEPYHAQLLSIFPKTIGLIQSYNGYAEYGHSQKLIKAEEKGNIFELSFEGQMMDGIGEFENRTFTLTYEIDNQSVIEHINNQDQYNQLKNEMLLNSIIPNKVILKAPLEVGTSWFENFVYEGQDCTAQTVITRVELTQEGKMQYETLTTVEGIEGYYMDTYKETRVFTEGSGMTSFSNLFSLESVGVDYEELEQSEDLYIFGFNLSYEKLNK